MTNDELDALEKRAREQPMAGPLVADLLVGFASLRRQLAEKEADIERLTRERDDAKLLAQNNLDWFNLLKPDFDAAIRQRDALKEVLKFYAERMTYTARTGMECGITRDHFGDKARAALATLDQPADAAKG